MKCWHRIMKRDKKIFKNLILEADAVDTDFRLSHRYILKLTLNCVKNFYSHSVIKNETLL